MAETAATPVQHEIALLGIPFDLGAGHPGSIMGPAALRIAGLPERLRELGFRVVDHGDLQPPPPADFDLPDDHPGRCNHLQQIAGWMRHIHDRAYALVKTGVTPVFMGGDHTIAMGSISAIARHCAEAGKELIVLWVDAHGDYNTPATTPTGNMHGMPLAFLHGEASLKGLLGERPFVPLVGSDVHLVGLRSIDPIERKVLRDSAIACFDMGHIDEMGMSMLIRSFIGEIVGRKVHVHVSFDVDALDPAVAPGVGTPVPGGITYREAHLMMELLHRSGMVGSLDLVELNPYLDDRGRSATVMAELAASLFGRTILDRPAPRFHAEP